MQSLAVVAWHLLAQISGTVQAILFLGTWGLVWLPIALILAPRFQWRPPHPPAPAAKLWLVGSLYLWVPLLVWGMIKLAQARPEDYGLVGSLTGDWIKPGFLGLGIGIGGVAIWLGIQLVLGWFSWQTPAGRQIITVLSPILLLAIWISATEEIVFRGVLLHHLQQDYGLLWAALVTSLIFSVLHLVWEGATARPRLLGLVLMGLVLVLARWVAGGNLGLAIGLHAGWICGLAGLDALAVVQPTDRGQRWLTGPPGQPLAGGLGLFLMLGTAGLLGILAQFSA